MLQLLKETAFRPIEAMRLTCQDVDVERQIVTLNKPAKRSNPRQVKISNKLTAMLKPLVREKKQNELIWSVKPKYISRIFIRNRKRIAKKLGSPNINKISLKTFRHFKATMEYHKTKDILYVKEFLGYKNIQNTLVYTHLVSFESDEWLCRVAQTIDEAIELIESGFEYITEYEGAKLFRK